MNRRPDGTADGKGGQAHPDPLHGVGRLPAPVRRTAETAPEQPTQKPRDGALKKRCLGRERPPVSPVFVKANSAPDSLWRVVQGDCLEVLGGGDISGVALIVTSPPYADQRASTYGGIHPDEYVEWFLPYSAAFMKALAVDGSFVLNIKEKATSGERHPYVMELILAMRKQGWRLVDEYIWHKKNCYPGKWPNRFRDAWERLLHFTLSPRFKMRQEAVMETMGDWSTTRLQNLSATDRTRDESQGHNGFGKRVGAWVGRDLAYPTNVLHISTECGYKGHPAAFPVALPEWFIKLFTNEGDLVLDPFAGSGTTLVAATALGRRSIGIEKYADYSALIEERLNAHQQLTIPGTNP